MKSRGKRPDLSRRMKENNPMKKLETRNKVSKTLKRKYADGSLIHPLLGKKRPDLTKRNLENNPAKDPIARKKISESRIGEDNPNYGKRGVLSPIWKGGPSLSYIRHSSKRRTLGYNVINEHFDGAEGHHIDKEHVIYIPKKMHRSVYHNLERPETMESINTKVFCWILGKVA